MKKLNLTLLVILLLCPLAKAQTQWFNPLDGDVPHIEGRAWNAEIGKSFHRFPPRAESVLRTAVWDLSTDCAGLSICFYTNAPEITIHYTVSGGLCLPNVTTIATSGLDLYTRDDAGTVNWCACPASYRFGSGRDTISYHYTSLAYNNHHKLGNEYRLFLPLYNAVTSMKIGIPAGSTLTFAPMPLERPIVVYGTSIAQGASASRPAMAWSNILQRRTDSPFINLGFSGNALMDHAVYDLLSEIDAKMYILDCMPNMYGVRDSIVARTLYGVKKIREKSHAPILLVENDGYTYSNTNKPIDNECTVTNRELRKAYEQLRSEGVEGIYYLTKEEIGISADSQIDGWHVTDLGMAEYADAYMKKITEILDIHPMKTFTPCTQRREPQRYEWMARHNAIIARNRTANPEILMIGNSITHFWAGEPTYTLQSGPKSWKWLFGKKSVTNMGIGWDRIENVFWRLYHGEIDDCHPKQICLLLGTNNLDLNSNEEIAEGIVGIVKLLRDRQPQAKIHVLKIYPRRGKEQQVRELNDLLASKMPTDNMVDIVDVTNQLLLTDGTGKIDETLFRDGLHPNENGYTRIAKVLKKVLFP
jgi:lysophospholipase L1-like esterase